MQENTSVRHTIPPSASKLTNLGGHQHGVPIQISINLEKTFLRISSIRKICCDLNLGESLTISTFFLFPDSGLNLMNDFFMLIYFEWRDTENQI